MSFLSMLTGRRETREQVRDRVDPGIDAGGSAYPPVDPGIQARSVDEILAAHEDLISRIKLCYGADRSTFEADLLVLVRNYASFVNLLPATSDNFFSGAGGLFRLGLEVAFFALQGTDGHIVSGRASISTRRHLEPRWRHATFIAGLCTELHRTLSHVVVTDERGEEWPAYLTPLTEWLTERKAARFFVRWISNAQESRALGLFALRHIVPAATMQHLAAGNSIAVPHMLSSLSGIPPQREQNILVDLVKRAAALVIDRDLIASANRYGRPILGAHLERYLLDAMRRLVASHPAWAPNQDRSRVWHARDGLFVVWPNAVSEIRKLLEEDELPGIPKAPDTILEILISAGVFEPRSDGQKVWSIAPPPSRSGIEAVKLSSPEILLAQHPQLTEPLDESIIARANAPTRGAAVPAERSSDLVGLAQSAPAETAPVSTVPVEPGGAALADTQQDGTRDISSGIAPASNGAPHFRLCAPMRLNPQVRDSLAAAIDTLNGDPKNAAAITVSTGVFVPLDHFKRARLDMPGVLRALAEMHMAVGAEGPRLKTVQHEIGGQTEFGFVLKPQFVEGLDPADFAPNV